MQYMLLIYRDESAIQRATAQDRSAMTGAFLAYTTALREAGAFVSGDRLGMANTATTVRVVEGNTRVLDGPYADTKEQLGGYYLIDVADLDAALGWAARCPGAQYGIMEVRPVAPV